MTSIIFHIDVNSAFLSWTAVEELNKGAEIDLRTIPAIIGGDQKSRRGVVVAKSIPAKMYGIRTGEPAANAFRKCKDLVSVPPDHALYKRKSAELMEYLRTFTDKIEQVSVDECYMDFTEIKDQYKTPEEGAIRIKNGVKERFGFTVNIGISTNKVLAKMASDFEKPDKVHTLYPEEIQKKMWPLPIGELYMAGKASVHTLKKLEINTIGDLALSDPELISLHLKSHGKTLWEFANGICDSKVQSEKQEAKGIGKSTTLKEDIDTLEEAEAVFSYLSEGVSERLKKANQKAYMISMEIKYSDFKSVSHQKQLDKATDDPKCLKKTAVELFKELWNGMPVRLLGIRTSKLVAASEPVQMSLFDMEIQKPFDEKHKKLNEALKEIRTKFGEDAVVKAGNMIS